MADSHAGSWFGLPDYGITEALAGYFSGGKTTDLSNTITGSYIQPQNQPLADPRTQAQKAGTEPIGYNSPAPTSNPQTSSYLYKGPALTSTGQSVLPGWDANQSDAHRADMQRQQDEFNNALNDSYAPIFANFDNQMQYLQNSWFPTQQAGINANLEQSMNTLGQQVGESKQEVNKLQGSADNQLQSALAQSVRDYNALKQQGAARYGNQSSTGGAISELVSQEAMRGRNNLQNQYQLEVGKLSDRLVSLDKYELMQKQNFKSQADQLSKEARATLDQRMMEIQSNRAMAESEKANRRLDAVQRFQQLQNQITADLQSKAQDLAIWKDKYLTTLANDYRNLQQGFAQPNPITAPVNQLVSSKPTTSVNKSLAFLPQLGSQQVDEWGRLMNPYS